jgi:N-acetylglutamate synthase-like GNAT family acetyltransferase
LLYQFIWGKAPLISLLKIHSDFQKQGYGSRLLSRFENDLRE